MRKILSLFFALMMAFSVSAKVAFLVPADNTDRSSLRFEEVDGTEQSPERRAYDWFNDTFVTPGNGQFLCFNDLSNIPTDVNAMWIYVDRINFNEVAFDELFTSERKEQLQAFVNAGGNLYLCKQATRLEKDLVGATDGQSSTPGEGNVITPAYNANGYIESATWGVDYRFEFTDDWQYRGGHAIYTNLPYRDDNFAELIWSKGRKITNNNCGMEIGWMGMNGILDKEHFHAFETRNNCQILGGWANGDGCHYGGIIEFFPTGSRKGTVIINGLAAYQFIANNNENADNNGDANGWANTKKMTENALNYLDIPKPTLAWNTETVPESGIIGADHIMTATVNDSHYSITYSADAPEIANIGNDGRIFFNYFGNATFKATVNGGDGWNTPKCDAVTISSEIIPVTGGDAAVTYAYVLPYSLHVMANYDNEDGKRPDYEAAQWFHDQFISGNVGGEHGCFVKPSDIASLNAATKVLWIHNDHVDQASADYYNDLGGETFRDNLAAFVNAGGHVFVSKQATRLIGDLGRDIAPKYENGGYSDINETWRVGNKWNLSGTEIDRSTHRVYSNMGTNTTIMAAGRHTNNNCVWDNFDGLPGSNDAGRISQYETNHNCVILGAWGHYLNAGPVSDLIECVGFVEYKPQTTNQGTIIAMGLASYHWANPTDALKTLTVNTLSYLNFMNARPCALDNTTPMETRLKGNDYYPDNTTTFLKLHPVCENINATYTLTNNPGGIARIQEGVDDGEDMITQLQFKKTGTVTLHITLTENRDNVNWPTGTYEYDREITFAYATENAAQAHINTYLESDFPGNGVTTENEVQMAMRLHPNVRGLDSVSYVIENHYDNTQGEAYKETKDGVTRLYFSKSGKVLLTINLRENNWVETWPMGDYQFTRVIEFNYTQEAGPTFPWPSQFETGAVGPNSVITLPATVAELPVTYEVTGNASLDGNVLTLANVQSGTVTVNASVTETGVKVTWPMGTYNYENALAFHAAEVGYLLPAAESIDHLKFSDDPDYQGQQPEYNAAKWFEDNYITCANPKGRFVTVDELPTLFAKGIKTLWVNIERVNIDNANGLLSACLADDGLKTYIQAGGNVLLTKQATRLAFTMGRIGYAPAFNTGEYFESNPGDSRSISTRMGINADEALDKSNHRLYADMLSWHDAKHVFLVGETCLKTNNYCSWQDFFTDNQGTHAYDNGNIQRLRDFETAWNATVFGIQGDVTDYCYSNVVEFNAIENEWAGRILAIGATGYQWGSANPTAELDNVKKLTANSLSYLLDEPLADEVYTRNGLTPGIYGTICFDYAVEAGHIEGAEIYELTSFNADGTGVILTQVDAMVAGRPYFFLATANELRLTYNGQRVAAGSYHGLVGHIGETTLHITPNVNNYILYNNELLLVNTDDIELPSYRAYINKYDEIPAYSEPTSNAPRRIMAIEPPHNAPTAVEAVDMQAAQGVYDIMGRKLSAPQGNGFYIINGQKVIITQ